jgi:hypothetical protein
VETLDGFQQNQRVIEDFTARTLAAIPSDYGRLYYVGSLRDGPDGRYQHEGLAALYSKGAVQQALEHCHKELFCRVLEMPLDRQEWDLRACLGALDREPGRVIEKWREEKLAVSLVPEGLPQYLTRLFRSNVEALLEVLGEDRVNLRGAA